MTQVIGLGSALKESSELVIPAVPGEFYRYSSTFTEDRSLYVFMKCKANKDRTLASAAELGNECNLVFLFGNPPHVCSIKTAQISGLLGDSVNGELFGETLVAPAEISIETFYGVRSQKNVEALLAICRSACSKPETSVALKVGSVIAATSDAGKYALFLVKQITPTSIEIDACHILL